MGSVIKGDACRLQLFAQLQVNHRIAQWGCPGAGGGEAGWWLQKEVVGAQQDGARINVSRKVGCQKGVSWCSNPATVL